MDESTRDASLEKAKKMIAHIGFPDELIDDSKLIEYYGNLTVDESKFFESMVRISKFDSDKTLSTLRKIVNKSDWESHSNVAMVNAYYNSAENSIRKIKESIKPERLIVIKKYFIEFPAGILQGVFFNADRPRYLNFGAIGSVIGHEITRKDLSF